MKNLLYIFIFLSTPCCGQSLYDLFSQEGLKLGAHFLDDVGVNNPNSFQFCGVDTICDLAVLKYYPTVVGFDNNAINEFVAIHIEGEKVYSLSNCNKNFLYDFSLEIGEKIPEGVYEDFILDTIYNVTLLDGSSRKRYDFSKGENAKTSWIYGLGDITRGFILAGNATNFFNCARIGDQLLWKNENSMVSCEESTCFQPIPFFKLRTEGNTIFIDNQTPCKNEYNFIWDFGDGIFSNEVNPVHEYQNFGCYQVTLQIEEDCFPFSIPHTVSANLCSNNAWEENYSLFINTYRPRFATISASEEILYYQNDILRTSNAGKTWTFIPLPVPANSFTDIDEIKFYDEKRGVLILDISFNPNINQTSILTTQDAGLTWQPAFASKSDPRDLELGDNGLAWIHLDNKIYRSIDFGNSWVELPEIFTFSGGDIYFVDESNLFRKGTGSDILYKSSNQGDSWEFTSLSSRSYNFIFFDAQNAYRYIRYTNQVEMTFDAGETWVSKELPFPILDLHFASEHSGWITSRDNTIYYTSDNFETLSSSHCTGIEINELTVVNDSVATGIIRNLPTGANNNEFIKMSFNKELLGNCISTSISEEIINSPNIYPNPTSSLLNINDVGAGDFIYKIFSMDGTLVLSGKSTSQIEVNKLAQGTYILSLEYAKGSVRQLGKFVILR